MISAGLMISIEFFFTFERYLKKKLCNLDKCINMAFKKYNYISYLHAILYNLKRWYDD